MGALFASALHNRALSHTTPTGDSSAGAACHPSRSTRHTHTHPAAAAAALSCSFSITPKHANAGRESQPTSLPHPSMGRGTAQVGGWGLVRGGGQRRMRDCEAKVARVLLCIQCFRPSARRYSPVGSFRVIFSNSASACHQALSPHAPLPTVSPLAPSLRHRPTSNR